MKVKERAIETYFKPVICELHTKNNIALSNREIYFPNGMFLYKKEATGENFDFINSNLALLVKNYFHQGNFYEGIEVVEDFQAFVYGHIGLKVYSTQKYINKFERKLFQEFGNLQEYFKQYEIALDEYKKQEYFLH
jgi:hypothetical protein